jgi:hypothetical protein
MFIFSNWVTAATHNVSWVMKVCQAYKIISGQEESQKLYFKESNTNFLFWKTAGWVFCVCAYRKGSCKCVLLGNYFGNILLLDYYLSFVQLNCLKCLFGYHIVLGTYCHIRNLVHYILLCKLFNRCADLQLVNVKLQFGKPIMNNKPVCTVMYRYKVCQKSSVNSIRKKRRYKQINYIGL